MIFVAVLWKSDQQWMFAIELNESFSLNAQIAGEEIKYKSKSNNKTIVRFPIDWRNTNIPESLDDISNPSNFILVETFLLVKLHSST